MLGAIASVNLPAKICMPGIRLIKITNNAIGKKPLHIPAKSGGLKVISDVTQKIK